MNWIYYAVIAILFAGVSDVFRKLGSNLNSAFFANLVFQAGAISFGIITFFLFGGKTDIHSRYLPFAFIGGLLVAAFSLFSFKALSIGPGVSTVMPALRIGSITLVALLGIVFLKEQFTLVKTFGLLLSCIGLYLLFSK